MQETGTQVKRERLIRMRNHTELRWRSLGVPVPTIKTCVFSPQIPNKSKGRGDKRGMGDKLEY